jgi:hypothetical protein
MAKQWKKATVQYETIVILWHIVYTDYLHEANNKTTN